jgi:hypothetical protein
MTTEIREINGYVQNSEGKWVMTEESKMESLRLYYSGRLAYDKEDTRHAIGRYNEIGEVIPFRPWVSTSIKAV